MATGRTRYGDDLLRVPALHADGQRRSIALTVSLLSDSAGAVAGIAAVVRDETARWAEEQRLRRGGRQAPSGPRGRRPMGSTTSGPESPCHCSPARLTRRRGSAWRPTSR